MRKQNALVLFSLVLSVAMLSFTVNIQKTYALEGDVNGDGVVDMRDVSFVAYYFGSFNGTKAHPHGWNPQADINGDQKVDMVDIAIVAKNFGETG
jgi:hypothetical protein